MTGTLLRAMLGDWYRTLTKASNYCVSDRLHTCTLRMYYITDNMGLRWEYCAHISAMFSPIVWTDCSLKWWLLFSLSTANWWLSFLSDWWSYHFIQNLSIYSLSMYSYTRALRIFDYSIRFEIVTNSRFDSIRMLLIRNFRIIKYIIGHTHSVYANV